MRRLLHILEGILFLCVGLPVASFFAAILWIVGGIAGVGEVSAECAVVFGSAHPPSLERRVDRAVELLREGSVQRLIFTGGGRPIGEGRGVEAQQMKQRAIARGVDASVLEVEVRSLSTVENLREVRPLLHDCQSVIAVSDRTHLPRIRLLAFLLDFPLAGTVGAGPASTIGEVRSVLREAAKIVVSVPPLAWGRFTGILREALQQSLEAS